MNAVEIERLLTAGIPGAQVRVSGDDGRHFEAVVVADAFEGLTVVKRHQMVYRALGDLMQDAIHALSIRTYTPAQWARASAGA